MSRNIRKEKDTMNVKIGTFALILKNPGFEKEQLVSELTKRGFEKKYYKLGLMKAYHMDGTEIPNKAQTSDFSDQYQLSGKLFSIAFAGDDILFHHQFGQNTLEIMYNLTEYEDELRSMLNTLTSFFTFELKDCELILLLRGIGSKNSEEGFTKWVNKLRNTSNFIYEKSGSDKIEYPREINNRCTSKVIMVRDEEYAIELRFESEDQNALLNDFKNSEKIGNDIILEVENEK